MNSVLEKVRLEAMALADKQPRPSFYETCAHELEYARNCFFDHPLLLRLREDVLPFLLDEYGHGIEHSKTVAIEAGAIVLAELAETDVARARHLSLLAQMSGLLHDTRRLEDEHARKGAELCGIILHDYPLPPEDMEIIALAVADHEAFTDPPDDRDPDARLVGGALYDADKFRWGPDNFTTTLWEMCDYHELPLARIIQRFPKGVDMIRKVAGTFRTGTGRTNGPEFIDIGLALGQKVLRLLEKAEDA